MDICMANVTCGCGTLVGKNILTVVLEVVLLCRLHEMRVSVSRETFTNAMCKQNSCRVRHQWFLFIYCFFNFGTRCPYLGE